MTADVDDDGERMVCAKCIGEAFLGAGVTRRCGEATCSFCGEVAASRSNTTRAKVSSTRRPPFRRGRVARRAG